MPTSRRRVLAAVAATAPLAGCIGDDGPETVAGPTDTGTPAPTDTATATDAAMEATVQVESHPEHGEILVGPEGLTLYMFDDDIQGIGESTCYDDCADAWPPLTVDGEPSAGDGVTADLDTIDRDDGSTQVTADGWPLYYYAPDEEPGDATGQGVGDVWWVLRPDGTPVRPGESTEQPTEEPTEDAMETAAGVQVREHDDLGDVLVGPEELTLYMFDSDSQGAAESTCYDDCADAWPPLTVDDEPTAGDGVTAALTTFERDDGELQVAADGWPLYYYAPDEEPGDATGQGVGDVWWVLRPDGTPVRSDTPTPSPTDTDADDGGDPGDGY